MASTNNKLCLGEFLLENLYLGENYISKMCLGETIIYESGTSEPEEPVIPEVPKINIDDYVTFEALEDGFTVSLSRNACEYCIDGVDEWETLSSGSTSPSISAGQTISLRGNCTITSSTGTTGGIGTFTLGKKCNVRGNSMALLYGDSGKDNTSLSGKSYAFSRLFYNATNLVSVSENFLPATTLATYCYNYMFYGCTGLISAPALPATTLQQYCYQYMFRGCSSLTTAPTLPATTLQRYCYQYMFQNCSKLNYIKAMFTTSPSTSYTRSWVQSVASSGTYVKNSSASYTTTGNNAIPSGWTVQTASS